jgi:hypothetical protein
MYINVWKMNTSKHTVVLVKWYDTHHISHTYIIYKTSDLTQHDMGGVVKLVVNQALLVVRGALQESCYVCEQKINKKKEEKNIESHVIFFQHYYM